MIKNRQFEGKITVENVPVGTYGKLVDLIKSFCRRACEIDPMDRLIEIGKTGKGMAITTTENQLAVKLAKKIRQVFKGDVKISHSPSPSDVIYVKLILKDR